MLFARTRATTRDVALRAPTSRDRTPPILATFTKPFNMLTNSFLNYTQYLNHNSLNPIPLSSLVCH